MTAITITDTTYRTGLDTWTFGSPRGAAHSHLGPCPACGARTYDHGGNWACVDPRCDHSPERLVVHNESRPDWWIAGIRVYLDGDAWCAVAPGFLDIQSSPAGFGATPREAVEALRTAA